MKKGLKQAVLCLAWCLILVVNLSSCKKDDVLNKTTSVTFNVSDESGQGSGDCYYRIIEPVANTSTTFTINAKYQKNVGWNGSHTFEDIAPGSYGCIIGGIGNTYRDFSIAEGEHVTINMRYYIAAYITTYFGTTVPVYQWSVNITKN